VNVAKESLGPKKKKDKGGGSYFSSPKTNIDFITTGCTLLDCVLGGGYPLGRISNIVGDKSTGKTLLAIEACANFLRQYPTGKVWYAESEAAFDLEYAQALGLKVDDVEFIDDIFTVEDFFKWLEVAIEELGSKGKGFFVLDSLDALSDEAEQAREIDDASYGMNKQKKMSELFRRLTKKMSNCQLHLLIVSQVRANIGVTFGRKTTRSGGKGLDFYASQVIYLAHTGQLTRTKKKVKRVVGVKIKAKCDKNKVGLPFRECDFPIEFGFGVDNVTACLNWLNEVSRLDEIHFNQTRCKDVLKGVPNMDSEDYNELNELVTAGVLKVWPEIESAFIPKRRKY
jgi:recombination protein RecA